MARAPFATVRERVVALAARLLWAACYVLSFGLGSIGFFLTGALSVWHAAYLLGRRKQVILSSGHLQSSHPANRLPCNRSPRHPYHPAIQSPRNPVILRFDPPRH